MGSDIFILALPASFSFPLTPARWVVPLTGRKNENLCLKFCFLEEPRLRYNQIIGAQELLNSVNKGINFFHHLACAPGPDISLRHCTELSPSNPSTLNGTSIKVHTEPGSSYGPHLLFQCLYWLTVLEKADKLEDLCSAKLAFPTLPPPLTQQEPRYNIQAEPGPGESTDDQPLGGHLRGHWQVWSLSIQLWGFSATTTFDSTLCVTGITILVKHW